MCVKYWPGGKDEPKVFGGYQVQLSELEKNKGDYITRKFKLSPVGKVRMWLHCRVQITLVLYGLCDWERGRFEPGLVHIQ